MDAEKFYGGKKVYLIDFLKDEKETFEKLKQKYPDFAKASQFMTGQEVQKIIIFTSEKVKDIPQLLLKSTPKEKKLFWNLTKK